MKISFSKSPLFISTLLSFGISSDIFAVYEDNYTAAGGSSSPYNSSYDGSITGDSEYIGSISDGFFDGAQIGPAYDINLSNLSFATVLTGQLPNDRSTYTEITAISYDAVKISMNDVSLLNYNNSAIIHSENGYAVNITNNTSNYHHVQVANSNQILGNGGIFFSPLSQSSFTFINLGVVDAKDAFVFTGGGHAIIDIYNHGSIAGDIYISESMHVFFESRSGSINNIGNITLRENAALFFQFEITDKNSIGTINLTGLFTSEPINFISLGFDVSSAKLNIGDSLTLISMQNVGNIPLTISGEALFDGETFWADNHLFSVGLDTDTVSIKLINRQIIPESSSYALILGAATLGLIAARRKRK